MVHARKDYQLRWPEDPAWSDPSLLSPGSTPIATDEPVMLFRAQDRAFIHVLEAYQEWLIVAGVSQRIIDSVEQHIMMANAWQHEHGCKMPDIPNDHE